MNTTLLVLRVVPGLLLVGHGLQKLVPARYSPPLLHAMGHRVTASAFEQLGIRPALPAVVLAASAEILGGFSLAAGLLTPVGTLLISGVMTTAITTHARNGIWSTRGGAEFPLLLLVLSFVISALGAGSYSINAWVHLSNWAGFHWAMSYAARAGIAVAIGAGGGLVTVVASSVSSDARALPSARAES